MEDLQLYKKLGFDFGFKVNSISLAQSASSQYTVFFRNGISEDRIQGMPPDVLNREVINSETDIIIIDKKVFYQYYYDLPAGSLKESGLKYFIIQADEDAKSWENLMPTIRGLIEICNIRKNSRIIAIGGGVVQDIAGFLASVLMRGVNWIYFPTTLVSQADSCIGGKTSINFHNRKNVIGTFYPPSEIYIDTCFLKSLPFDDIRSGLGEMLHYYILFGWDQASLLKNMCTHVGNSKIYENIFDFVKTSLQLKKEVIEKDPFDKRERRLLNYGHTFGHAIETVSGFTIKHGIAVTQGMDMANYLAYRMGHIHNDCFEELRKKIAFVLSDEHLSYSDPKIFIDALRSDKKNTSHDSINFILPESRSTKFGEITFREIPVDIDRNLEKIIEDYFNLFEYL